MKFVEVRDVMHGVYYVVFVILFLLFTTVQTFNPTVRVNSCANNRVTFTLTNASTGGIVYVNGAGPGCRHVTHAGTHVMEFTFSSCGIIWGRSFRIVVQRKALYHTAEDKIIPVTCITDLSDINVHTSLNIMSKEDEPEQTVMIKPTAFMTLYSGGNDVSGKTVKITNTITLKIELYQQYKGSFDIKATTCKASNIPLISGGCATDRDLFPTFSKPNRGVLMSSFKAFIPTDQTNNRMAITFSCILDICVDNCPITNCSNSTGSYGRRRRHNISYEQIQVDSSVLISSEGNPNSTSTTTETKTNDKQICISWIIFAPSIAILIVSVILTIYFGITTQRWKNKYYYQKSCQYLRESDTYSYSAMSTEFDTTSAERDIISTKSESMSTESDRISEESLMMSAVSSESQIFTPPYHVQFV